MTTVKVWCKVCKGSGRIQSGNNGGGTEYCGYCDGNGYTCAMVAPDEFTIHDANFSCRQNYDTMDAVTDAAVLTALDKFTSKTMEHKVNPKAQCIAVAILDRLHRFYCGGGK